MVQKRQVKGRASRLIVHDLHIDLVLILKHVHAVDPPAKVHGFPILQRDPRAHIHLERLRLKIALPDLVDQRTHRPVRNPLHLFFQVGVSRGTLHDRVPVLRGDFLHRPLHESSPLRVRDGPEILSMVTHIAEKGVQGLVEQISHVGEVQLILSSRPEPKSMIQEVGVGASSVTFHSRPTAP